jgi:hypothetical protein
MHAVEVLEIGKEYAVGRAHGVLMLHVVERMPEASITSAAGRLLGARSVRGYLQILPLLDAFPGLGDAEKKAWTALAQGLKGITVAGALVVPQRGFVGAAMRAAISGVLLVTRGRTPTKVFASLDEAARYLASERAVDDGVAAALIVQAAGALAAAHASHPRR